MSSDFEHTLKMLGKQAKQAEKTRIEAEAAQRRRERLGVLRPHDGVAPLAMALAEFKAAEACPGGYRIWLKHLTDAPLLASGKTWGRMARTY